MSISRVLWALRTTPGGHSARTVVANRLVRPTRELSGPPRRSPIRACSGRGLASRHVSMPLVGSYPTFSPLPALFMPVIAAVHPLAEGGPATGSGPDSRGTSGPMRCRAIRAARNAAHRRHRRRPALRTEAPDPNAATAGPRTVLERRRMTPKVARSAPQGRCGPTPASPSGPPDEATCRRPTQALPRGHRTPARVLIWPACTHLPVCPGGPPDTGAACRATRCEVVLRCQGALRLQA